MQLQKIVFQIQVFVLTNGITESYLFSLTLVLNLIRLKFFFLVMYKKICL
jgi:hypothetical protein